MILFVKTKALTIKVYQNHKTTKIDTDDTHQTILSGTKLDAHALNIKNQFSRKTNRAVSPLYYCFAFLIHHRLFFFYYLAFVYESLV